MEQKKYYKSVKKVPALKNIKSKKNGVDSGWYIFLKKAIKLGWLTGIVMIYASHISKSVYHYFIYNPSPETSV